MTTSPATVWLNNGRIALFKEILVSHNLDVEEDKLLAFDDWLRLFNVPFVKSLGFVPLIENCIAILEYTRRSSFELPSAIVALRYVVRLATKVMLLFRFPSLSIKDGFGSNKE